MDDARRDRRRESGIALSGDKHLQERGITKIITPAAGSPMT
jgi:hypothetical protein